MDIYEFVNLLTDDSATVAVFDLTTGEEIYLGEAREAQLDFADYEIMSIDLVPKCEKTEAIIVLNIETEDEGEEDGYDRWEVEPSRDDWDEEE